MRKKLLCLILVVLMLGTICVIPTDNQGILSEDPTLSNQDFNPLPNLNQDFIPSTDGDQSSDNVNSFSETVGTDILLDPDSDTNADAVFSNFDLNETLADDVLFYPDAVNNGTITYASDSATTGDLISGSYTDTHALDTTYWKVGLDPTEYMLLEFTVPTVSGYQIEAVEFAMYAEYYAGAGLTATVDVYNFDTTSWTNIGNLVRYTATWFNVTHTSPDYWNSTSVLMRIYAVDDVGGWIDYAEVQFHIMTLADPVIVDASETFEDVVKWTIGRSGADGSDDGVVVSNALNLDLTCDAATNEYVYFYWDFEDFDLESYQDWYVSVRWYVSNSSGAVMRLRMRDSDNSDLTVDALESQTYESYTVTTVQMSEFMADADYTSGDDASKWYFYLDDATNEIATGNYIMYVQYIIMHEGSAIPDHYADSMSDVSDWYMTTTNGLGGSDYFMTSDGDVGNITIILDSVDVEYAVYQANLSMEIDRYNWIEMRYKVDGQARIYLRTWDSSGVKTEISGLRGDGVNLWTTSKFYLDDYHDLDDIYAVDILCDDYSNAYDSGTASVFIDYVRIFPANESGWQHDGSTIQGITTSYSISTDGDKLNLTNNVDGVHAWDFYIDTTSTQAKIERDYYTWVEWSITAMTDGDLDGNVWLIRSYSASGTYDNIPPTVGSYTDAIGTFRVNLKETPTAEDPYRFRFYLQDENDEIVLDYIKLYGLEDWKYSSTQSHSDMESVVYWDSTEDALALDLDTNETQSDWNSITTFDQTLNYDIADMVILATVKAETNSTAKFEPYANYDSGDTNSPDYYPYDGWMHVAFPLTTSDVDLDYMSLAISDVTSGTDGIITIYIKNNITIRPSWYDASGESNTYGESFAVVSEWDTTGLEGSDSLASDGDLVTITTDATSGSDYIWDNTPSSQNGYLEMRYKHSNLLATYARVYVWTADDKGGSNEYFVLTESTDWTTSKWFVTVADIECVEITIYKAGADAVNLIIDYIRFAPSDEMGWQVDGSQVNYEVSSGVDTVVSDGDTIHETGSGASYSHIGWYPFYSQTKYPFLEIRWKADVGQDFQLNIYNEDDTGYTSYFTETGTWVTTRLNIDAIMTAGTYVNRITLKDGRDNIQDFMIDYVKSYSIANFTIAGGSLDANDVAYVSSGSLIVDGDMSYMQFNQDLSISVTVATYNVWNATISAGSSNFKFREFADADNTFTQGDVRGVLTSTTLTDYCFYAHGDMTISAISFWTDTTDPVIDNIWALPYSPTEDDDVTISMHVTEWTGLESAIMNAFDYPSGFSDVDYDLVESTATHNFYSYTFSTGDLPAGYYSFQITVDDGQGTDVEVVVFRVVSINLQVTDIVLITATEELAQLSGYINKDASYQIFENDTSVGSGSVSTGWFSVSWTKDTTAGAYIVLGINFTSGIYEEWVNGSYSVASADVLQITDSVYSATDDWNYLGGYASLDVTTWIAYNNNTQMNTGSLSAGSFSISWAKNTTAGLYEWGVSFTDGTTTRWINGSYQVATATILAISDTMTTSTSTEVQLSGVTNLICNYYVFSNDTYKSVTASLAVGSFAITWVKETAVALHRWAIKFNDTSTTRWVNGSYSVSSTTFLISDTVTTEGTTEMSVSGYTNLACNYYVYSNDTYESVTAALTPGSFTVRWTKSLTVALHRWAIKFNVTGTTRWVNGTYSVSSTTFLISDPVSTSTSLEVTVSGFTNLACNYTIYSNDSSVDTGSLTAGNFEVNWPKNTTIGTHSWGIMFNNSGTLRWVNGSYYVSATYGWSYIYFYDQSGNYIDWETFTILVNGSQIQGNSFYDRTDYAYLIITQDVYGMSLNTTTFNYSRTIRIILDVYTFAVFNMHDEQFIYFNMTRSGGARWSRHIGPQDHISYELLASTSYEYEYTYISTDGTIKSASGTLSIDSDTALIITDIGLILILNEIRLISPGGGIGKETFETEVAKITGALGLLWGYLWGLGIFLVIGLWIVPFVSRRRKGQSSSPPSSSPPSSKPSEGTSKPKKSGSHVIPSTPQTQDLIKDARKKAGLPKKKERRYQSRQ